MKKTFSLLKKYLRRFLKGDICGFTELDVFGELPKKQDFDRPATFR